MLHKVNVLALAAVSHRPHQDSPHLTTQPGTIFFSLSTTRTTRMPENDKYLLSWQSFTTQRCLLSPFVVSREHVAHVQYNFSASLPRRRDAPERSGEKSWGKHLKTDFFVQVVFPLQYIMASRYCEQKNLLNNNKTLLCDIFLTVKPLLGQLWFYNVNVNALLASWTSSQRCR